MSVMDMPKTDAAPAEEAEPKGGRKKLVLVVAVLALVAGAAYWFVLKPDGGPSAPEPGAVVKLDAIQINLADDHYLKVGIALQATKDAGEELDGSKALDETIALFSGQSTERLAKPAYREKLKAKLEHRLEEAYEGEVMGCYFTDFVTQ
jgi:flagellar FliL protein